MRAKVHGRFTLLLAGGALAFAMACQKGAPTGAAPLDTDVLAFLSSARALHHQANVLEDAGDDQGATKAMERLVTQRRPRPTERVPEVDEVLADAYARLADLRLRTGDVEGAGRDVAQGLEHTREPSYYRGHLLEVEGIVEEMRAHQLVDGGQPAEAALARARALRALEESVSVQSEVIRRSLDSAGSPDGGRR